MALIDNKSLLAKVRKIKIISRGIATSNLVGNYVSAFKGVGFEFNQLREYHYGDDVRFINWNASAKNNTLMLKEFIPERDRTVILAIDCSSSMQFASHHELKSDTAVALSSALAVIANLSNDRIGLLAFAEKKLAWVPPQKGRLVLTKLLDQLCLNARAGGKTNFVEALRFLLNNKLQHATIFFISDWIDCQSTAERELKLLSKKHDFVAVRVLDQLEKKLPSCKFLMMQDLERPQGLGLQLDALQSASLLQARLKQQQQLFAAYGIDLLDLTAGDPVDRVLANFFHKRTKGHK